MANIKQLNLTISSEIRLEVTYLYKMLLYSWIYKFVYLVQPINRKYPDTILINCSIKTYSEVSSQLLYLCEYVSRTNCLLDVIVILIKFDMSKQKFIATNRDRFHHQKTQEPSPHQQKKSMQRHRQMLIPIEVIAKKHPWHGKSLRSEGKSSERQGKMPIFQLINLKESLLLKQQKDSFNIKNITKKRTSTNRIMTEKISQPSTSTQKKSSISKIIIKGGAYSKQVSPDKNNFVKQDIDRIWASQKMNEPHNRLLVQSPRKSVDKKLTAFQKQQSKGYQVFYIGNRRISSIQDFTNSEGDPKVMIGDSIAYKYQILSVLGRGSFGQVFRVFDHKKKQTIALKIIKNQQKFNVQAKVQIQILQTALLQDPKLRNNIVRLKGSFIFRGHTCLKFQILSKNLYEFLKQTNFAGFSLDLIRRFSIQILQALYFFNKNKIIHCDLKPENILLKQENKSGIKVIDVGSGCFQGKQIYTYIQSRFYRAPEIVLGVRYTSAIDMWSLGCILVELYTGVPVFPGQNENQQMFMFIQLLGLPPQPLLQRAQRRKKFFNDEFACKIPAPKNRQKLKQAMTWKNILGTDCDKSFIDLVKKCLVWNPEQRITARQALLHEWILSGLPHTIRSQHVEQLNEE